jgi:hypothetical protein
MTRASAIEHYNTRKFDHKLWVLMLGAPVLWLIYLQTIYALVQFACSSGQHSVLHIGSAFFLGLTMIIGGISFAQWSRIGRGWPSDQEGGSDGRRRAMAMIGLLQSALFALLIVTSWAAIIILNPCEGASWP